jgi:hypothetical protein
MLHGMTLQKILSQKNRRGQQAQEAASSDSMVWGTSNPGNPGVYQTNVLEISNVKHDIRKTTTPL